MNGFDSDSIPYFKTSNRYRDIAISPNGQKIYLLTDSIGTTSGPSGTGTSSLENPGAILEFSYAGAALPLGDRPVTVNTVRKYEVTIFPNPASQFINIRIAEAAFTRPTRYQLLDLTGKLILQGNSVQKDFNIDIVSLVSGVYILKQRWLSQSIANYASVRSMPVVSSSTPVSASTNQGSRNAAGSVIRENQMSV
jgi:hypothetical protein